MKDWKTTLGGIITSIGLFLLNVDNPTLKLIGQILAPIGTLLIGFNAQDQNSK